MWKKPNNHPSPSSPPPTTQPQPTSPLHFNPQTFHTHFSTLLQNLSSQFPTLIHQSLQKLQTTISPHKTQHPHLSNSPNFANLSFKNAQHPQIKQPLHCFDLAMAPQDIEERLTGVPVYALSNSNEEFVLISGVSSGKSLGLFCFNKDDADTLLEQMRSMDPGMRRNSKVVAVALNKVIQLKLDGVAFRFIPDSSQIKNAIKVKQSAGLSDSSFSGVPVFQSRSLVVKSENKRYRPIFFRKEDLEKSLRRAATQQNRLNPIFRQGDIQVSVLEEIIQTMKVSSTSKWDDVVFIPPGLDLLSTITPEGEAVC